MPSSIKQKAKEPAAGRALRGGATSTTLAVVGCGDAFGSGGRLQTCFHVSSGDTRFLIDCGATALIGLNRLQIDPNDIGSIVLSHLHGDHFAGLIWYIMHAKHISGRTAPLRVIGPEGTEERYVATAELLYPGSTGFHPAFELTFHTFYDRACFKAEGFDVTPFEVNHPSGSLSAALRIEIGDTVLAFSGDTEWVDNLIPCAANADLYISECYGFDGSEYYHMTWETLKGVLPGISAKKILLTHLNEATLAKMHLIQDQRVSIAEDGLVVDV